MTKVIGRGMSMIACTAYVCTVYNTSCILCNVNCSEGDVEEEGSNDGNEPKKKSKKVCNI